MNLRLAMGLATALVSPLCLAQAPTLNLFTFDSPPYQVAGAGEAGGVSGETTETVVCAANGAGWSTRIRIAPQNRAIHSLNRNMVDGYFAIDPSIELDALARRSDPVALEKWYFFTRGGKEFTRNSRIGVVDGSNEEAWLEANGYPIFLSVASSPQLVALLKRGRIDTALMDERVMSRLRAEAPTSAMNLEPHFVRYAPLYLYLNETFVANHPKFLSEFNRKLTTCMAGQLALSEEEERRIRKLWGRLVTELISIIDIRQIVASAPRQVNYTDVMTIDSKWQALAPLAMPEVAARILALPGSRALEAWQDSHKGLITEVMLINNMGTVAAMSRVTSDYWQGDEPKFQLAMQGSETEPGRALFISPIRYDPSTSRFQIDVSAPVLSGNGDPHEGVIVVGLDIESALNEIEQQ